MAAAAGGFRPRRMEFHDSHVRRLRWSRFPLVCLQRFFFRTKVTRPPPIARCLSRGRQRCGITPGESSFDQEFFFMSIDRDLPDAYTDCSRFDSRHVPTLEQSAPPAPSAPSPSLPPSCLPPATASPALAQKSPFRNPRSIPCRPFHNLLSQSWRDGPRNSQGKRSTSPIPHHSKGLDDGYHPRP